MKIARPNPSIKSGRLKAALLTPLAGARRPLFQTLDGFPMQTFDEIEYKLLNQHGDEYKNFTRLILTLSVACLTILASNNFKTSAPPLLISLSLSLHFLSILFGIIVQHRIMMNPIYHLQLAQKSLEQAAKNQDGNPISLRRKPTKIEQLFYRLQCFSFVSAFLFLALYSIQ